MESKNILALEKKETENFIKESENKFEQLMVHKKKSLEQKLVQMKNKAIKDIQYISNKIALETVKKVILDTSYRDWETDRKSTRLNSSHSRASRMPSSA